MHRYLLAALAALLAYTLEVKAADPGTRAKIIAPVQVVADEPVQWNRTGFYATILAGYDVTVFQADDIGEAASGKLMGGAAVGWNWRASQYFVLGLEVDWMFTGISANSGDDELAIKASTNHLISARGRAGVPLGPALIYFTGGPAWQYAKLSTVDGPALEAAREWQLGLAVGGGAEVELSRGLALRVEGLHYRFPKEWTSLLDSENNHTTIRGGIVFKLN